MDLTRKFGSAAQASWPVILFVLGFSLAGCQTAPRARSSFNVGDQTAAYQLTSGFWGVEAKPSRWTTRVFSFMLKPPSMTGHRRGKFWMRFFIPDSQIRTLGPMTLNAAVDDYALEAETFTEPGMHTFSRDVPADVLDTNIVPIYCAFDRAALPSKQDGRELGVVMIDVGIQAESQQQ